MAGDQRKDLEIAFDSVHNVSGSPLWRTWGETLFIGVPNKTEPQAALSQMATDSFSKALPFFARA